MLIFLIANPAFSDVGKWKDVAGQDRMTGNFVNYAFVEAPNAVFKNLDPSRFIFQMEKGYCTLMIKPNFVLETNRLWLKIDEHKSHYLEFKHQGDWYTIDRKVELNPNLFSKDYYSCQKQLDLIMGQIKRGKKLVIRFNTYGNNLKDVTFSLRGSSKAIDNVLFMAPIDLDLPGETANTTLTICLGDSLVEAGPVAYLCRTKCSLKPLFFRRQPGFASPMLNAVGVDCRNH